MKITVLMGSPRKKDSAGIISNIERKLNEQTKAEFNYIYLKNKNIEDCRGCDGCFNKGEIFCPIKDDLKSIVEQMQKSDGVIFASPVYAHQITAPMKRLIDRLSYLFHRPQFFKKFSIIVITTASTGIKPVKDYLNLISTGWGFNNIGKIAIVSTMYKDDSMVKYQDKVNFKIEKVILNIINYKDIVEKKQPTFFALLMFLAMREKAKHFQIDTEFWEERNWWKSTYFYRVKLSIIKTIYYFVLKYLLIPIVLRK